MGSRGGKSGKASGGGANNTSQTRSWEDISFEEPILSPLAPTKAAERIQDIIQTSQRNI